MSLNNIPMQVLRRPRQSGRGGRRRHASRDAHNGGFLRRTVPPQGPFTAGHRLNPQCRVLGLAEVVAPDVYRPGEYVLEYCSHEPVPMVVECLGGMWRTLVSNSPFATRSLRLSIGVCRCRCRCPVSVSVSVLVSFSFSVSASPLRALLSLLCR